MNKCNFIYIITFIFASLTQMNAQNDILNDENVTIFNESVVNDPKLDFSPAFYEDGVVFISSQTDKKNKVYDGSISSQAMMIKIARRGPNGKLLPPVAFAEELVTPFHEGPITFDKVGEEAYFSKNNYENGKLVLAKENENGKNRALQQIYHATKAGNKWTNVKKLVFNQSEYSFRHPSLSIDGKKLYFSSNRPGGKGGYDIWVSSNVGGEWSDPVNAGDEINTSDNEAFPFIHADGTLFFASDKKGGLGGFDIYFAKAKPKKGFELAKNIGLPFNSDADDFGLILDLNRKNGYFTSARKGGKGMDDIYGFHSEQKVPFNPEEAKQSKAVLCVLDKADNNPIAKATVKYVNIDNYNISEMLTDGSGSINKLTSAENVNILQLVTDQPLKVLETGDDCKTPFIVEEGEYLVNVFKEGYAPKQVIFKAKKDKELYQVLIEKLDGKIKIAGTLKDGKGRGIAGAKVSIIDDETGEEQIVTTDPQGQYSYAVKPTKCYTLKVNKPNYTPQTTKVCPEKTKPNQLNEIPVEMKIEEISSPFVEGKVIELANVYYNFNDATLRPDALVDINALLTVMKDYPEIEIELASHTDCRASDVYNIDLSQRRAESVVKYLVENGISARRMRAKGYGETQLKNGCADGVQCTEEEHQRNRRTEVKITRAANNAKISVVDNLPKYIDAKPGATTPSSPIYASTDDKLYDIPNQKNVVNTSKNTSIENATNGRFWVIAGSFSNAQNAVEQQLKMLNLGFPETTIEYSAETNTNRVVVGKMESMEAANQRVKELKSKGQSGLFVLQK